MHHFLSAGQGRKHSQARQREETRGLRVVNMGEFVDALHALRRGCCLVRFSDLSGGTVLDGARLFYSFDALLDSGVIEEFENPHGFEGMSYFRITEGGRDFAHKALQAWRSTPLRRRIAIRFLH